MSAAPPPSPTFPHLTPTLWETLKSTPTPTFYRGVGVVGRKCGNVSNSPHLLIKGQCFLAVQLVATAPRLNSRNPCSVSEQAGPPLHCESTLFPFGNNPFHFKDASP